MCWSGNWAICSVQLFSENFSSVLPVSSLMDKWCSSSRLPDPRLHPIGVWDDIVTNR